MATETGTIGTIARRYATALYELGEEARALKGVAEDLRGVRTALAESADLARLATSPVVSRKEQAAAMAAFLAAANAHDLTRRFIGVVITNGRLSVLGGIINGFMAELARRRGEVAGLIISARPLSEVQTARVASALRAVAGNRVAMETRVDPALIGGMVVRVGSRMVDSSVKTKLQRLQMAMKGAR